jgi:hypothetical protein
VTAYYYRPLPNFMFRDIIIVLELGHVGGFTTQKVANAMNQAFLCGESVVKNSPALSFYGPRLCKQICHEYMEFGYC